MSRFSMIVLLSITGLMLIACRTTTTKDGSARIAASPVIEGTWTHSGGTEKPMQMVFSSGGVLSFHGGFEYNNPASWQYNPVTKLLKIKVTVKPKNELLTMQRNFEIQNANRKTYELAGQGLIERVLPETGEVIFRLGGRLLAIDWMGWTYYKNGQSQ